ncbi:MAG: helix-turn-helix transcriptional regulator [Clostridia bacterium]|nr:helix-turn-helix transcriptional regulator [Clostridia bacterium]
MESIAKITPVLFTGALTIKNPVFKLREQVDRKSYGICFATSGKMIYYHNGKEYISDKKHALLLPQGATYTQSCVEEGEFLLIQYKALEGTAPNEFLSIEINDVENYIGEFQKLEKLWLIKPPNGHLSALRTIYEVLNRLYKNELALERDKNYDIIRPAVRFLEDNFTDTSLSNEILAEKAAVSEVYFRRVFKSQYGTSPKQYIQNLRIRTAENLLRNEYLSITSIAEMSGFSSVYHFSRTFKKATGYTPSEYVKAFGGAGQ